ncbi:MAG: hypothetical protein ACTSQ0_06785, partial [Candidatus Heimdallarchaeota archaeon]
LILGSDIDFIYLNLKLVIIWILLCHATIANIVMMKVRVLVKKKGNELFYLTVIVLFVSYFLQKITIFTSEKK